MDPTQTLSEALDAARDIRRAFGSDDTETALAEADALVTYFTALHEWLQRGGFLPAQWAPAYANSAQESAE